MAILQLLSSPFTCIFFSFHVNKFVKGTSKQVFWEWGINEIYLALWFCKRYPCIISESVTENVHSSLVCKSFLGNYLHTWQCFLMEWNWSIQTKLLNSIKSKKLPFHTFSLKINLFVLELVKGFVSVNCIQLEVFYQWWKVKGYVKVI